LLPGEPRLQGHPRSGQPLQGSPALEAELARSALPQDPPRQQDRRVERRPPPLRHPRHHHKQALVLRILVLLVASMPSDPRLSHRHASGRGQVRMAARRRVRPSNSGRHQSR
ncbi:unnamed protein product, partial [Musa textilis]